ncbi:MAG: putative bifunctional diguanylate cyclase/phosphodiesterase [Gemmatimonadaceae bacterium]
MTPSSAESLDAHQPTATHETSGDVFGRGSRNVGVMHVAGALTASLHAPHFASTRDAGSLAAFGFGLGSLPSFSGFLQGTVATLLLGAIGLLVIHTLASPPREPGAPLPPSDVGERPIPVADAHSPVGIALLDRSSGIVHANAALEQFLGYTLVELRGRRMTDFSSPEDADEALAMVREVASGRRDGGAAEGRFVCRDGSLRWGALSISSAGTSASVQFVAVLQDVTERKALEAKLVHQATHDPLTELPNRALFLDRVEHALSRSARGAERVAVIFLDLDGFKAVNDTLGHGAGDRLLQVVARRLLGATRGCDTVARLGGDEFAVLLGQIDALAGAEAVVERVVSSLRQPVEVGSDRSVSVGASFGIAVYSGLENTAELLRNADVAMYEAKLRNPGRWVVFDPAMQTALIDRVTLEADMRRALERCQLQDRPHMANTGVFAAFEAREKQTEFTVSYQPIVDLPSGRVTGVEALARWTHPERGAVSPEAFIPLAERSGTIGTLGRWILHEACRQGAAWNASRLDAPITMTVNLSGKQLEHEGIVAEVDAVLRDTGLAPEQLVLEITETVIMQNAESTLTRLQELKALGVRLAIDDFGTGYSSLSYLQRFPVDIVKIDRVFADGLRHGAEGVALVRTILALADMLTLRTIAEGVEEASQREQLLRLGCTTGQGYLYGRPMSAADINALLTPPRLDVAPPAIA